jgi:Putative MetA-pathway of phenol degradation
LLASNGFEWEMRGTDFPEPFYHKDAEVRDRAGMLQALSNDQRTDFQMAGRQIFRERTRSRLGQAIFQLATSLVLVAIASSSWGQTPAIPQLPKGTRSSEMIESYPAADAKPSNNSGAIHVEGMICDQPGCDQMGCGNSSTGAIHVEGLICDQPSCDQMGCDGSSGCDSYMIRSKRQRLLGCLPCPQDPGTLFDWPCQSRTAGVPRLWEPIVADRPTFTESSSTVGLGVAQVESGSTYSRDDEPGTKTRQFSIGEPILRYGIFRDWLELRVGAGYQDIEVNDVDRSGIEDMLVGFKIGLTPQDDFRPEMALIAQSSVPTGASSVSQDEWLPELKLIYGWEINDRLATRGSTQVGRAIQDTTGDDDTQWNQSWMASYRLHPRTKVFGEWFALVPTSDEETEHYVSTGLTYLLTNDIQWDLRGGWGLNDEALDSFVGTGLSWRFR